MPKGDRQTIEPYVRGERQKLHDPVTGRYTAKLNDEISSEIVRRLAAGVSIRAAAHGAGVSYTTVEHWLRQGRTQTGGPEHEVFADKVDQALGDLQTLVIGTIYQRGMEGGDTKALTWLAERKWPTEFGGKPGIVIDIDAPERPSTFPMLDTSKLTDEELDALISLHEKGRPESGRLPDIVVDAKVT